MKSEVLQEPAFQNIGEIQQFRQDQMNKRKRNAFISILLFVALTQAISIYRYLITVDLHADALFYRALKHFQVNSTLVQESSYQIKDEGQLAVTQQELGKMAWTILHMATGTFPSTFNSDIAEKFNAFLILFGELYPCKKCGFLFLKWLDEMKPFHGQKKQEIMVYLCHLHNKINQQIGKQVRNCSRVAEEWNTCGCDE